MTRRRPPDPLDDVEVAQLPQRGLHRRLLRLVGDEHEAGVVAEALLLRGADADAVAGEHPGDRVQHAGPVGHVEPRWYSAVVSSMARIGDPAERAERGVGAELAG